MSRGHVPYYTFCLGALVTLLLFQPVPTSGQTPRSEVIASMDRPTSIELSEGTPRVGAGPTGGDVLQFGERFKGTINLKERGIEISRYDHLTMHVKADRAAFLSVSLDRYPWSGKQAKWYVLNGMRGPLGWRTIWIDLRGPEEGHRKEAARSQLTLHVSRFHKDMGQDTGQSIPGRNRTMMPAEIRAVNKAVALGGVAVRSLFVDVPLLSATMLADGSQPP